MASSRYLRNAIVIAYLATATALSTNIKFLNSTSNGRNNPKPLPGQKPHNLVTGPGSSPAPSSMTVSIASASTWTFLGCYTDNYPTSRTLPYTASIPGGGGAMTVEACQSACSAAGYSLAGVEYAQECCTSLESKHFHST